MADAPAQAGAAEAAPSRGSAARCAPAAPSPASPSGGGDDARPGHVARGSSSLAAARAARGALHAAAGVSWDEGYSNVARLLRTAEGATDAAIALLCLRPQLPLAGHAASKPRRRGGRGRAPLTHSPASEDLEELTHSDEARASRPPKTPHNDAKQAEHDTSLEGQEGQRGSFKADESWIVPEAKTPKAETASPVAPHAAAEAAPAGPAEGSCDRDGEGQAGPADERARRSWPPARACPAAPAEVLAAPPGGRAHLAAPALPPGPALCLPVAPSAPPKKPTPSEHNYYSRIYSRDECHAWFQRDLHGSIHMLGAEADSCTGCGIDLDGQSIFKRYRPELSWLCTRCWAQAPG